MSKRPGIKGSQPKVDFPNDLFTSLRRGDLDEATNCLRNASINDTGEPSPTAKKLMETGEWDLKELLALVYVDATSCTGKVGTDGLRFCGKAMPYCNVSTHPRNTVGSIQRGWYISCGRNAGVLLTPHLPSLEDGGPVDAAIAARLTGTKPYKLIRGQWKFIIDSWHSLKVETIEDDESLDEQLAKLSLGNTSTMSKTGNEAEVANPKPPLILVPTTEVKIPEAKPATNDHSATEGTSPGLASDARDLLAAQSSQINRLQMTILTMESRTRTAEEQAQRSEKRMRDLEAFVRGYHARIEEDNSNYATVVRRYRDKVKELEGRLETLASAQVEHNDGVLDQALLDKIETLDRAMFAPTGAFTRFKDSFIEFKDRIESGGGVECNSVAFSSYHDFMAWFDKHEPSVDIFLDGIAYMHAIRAPVVHSDDATKQRELQQKTSIGTALEATVITSFDTVLPSILVGGGGKRGDTSQGGAFDWLSSYLKTFEIWKPVGTNHGVSHQITNGVTSVSKRITELRKKYADSDVVLLSNGLCQDSANFCHEFVRFINDQQEELTNNTAYTEEQIWQMQLECIQKIVEELSEAREPFGDAGRTSRGNLVWGMLMAWQIQQRYMTNHFKDDPALTGVLVRRILMQGQDQSVKKKMAKIDALEAKVTETKNHATTEIGKVKAEVNKLKEEISKLKK